MEISNVIFIVISTMNGGQNSNYTYTCVQNSSHTFYLNNNRFLFTFRQWLTYSLNGFSNINNNFTWYYLLNLLYPQHLVNVFQVQINSTENAYYWNCVRYNLHIQIWFELCQNTHIVFIRLVAFVILIHDRRTI